MVERPNKSVSVAIFSSSDWSFGLDDRVDTTNYSCETRRLAAGPGVKPLWLRSWTSFHYLDEQPQLQSQREGGS